MSYYQQAIELPWPPSGNTYYRHVLLPAKHSVEDGELCGEVIETLRSLDWSEDNLVQVVKLLAKSSPRSLLSSKGRAYKAVVAEACHGIEKPGTDARLRVSILLRAPTARKYDLDNRCKALLDGLEAGGILPDDEQVDELIVRRGELDRPNGSALLVVEEL